MAVKFTSEVSIMDVFAIGGLLLGGAAVFFNYGTDIHTNKTEIAHLKSDVVRIERTTQENDKAILDRLKEQTTTIKEIKSESAEGRKRIEDKLDKIIDRELNGRGR